MRESSITLKVIIVLILVICAQGMGKTVILPQFRNITAAVDTLMSGDTLLCDSGIYQGFEITKQYDSLNPLVIKSKVLHGAQVITGGNCHFIGAQGVVLDGFEVRGPNITATSGLIRIENNGSFIANYITIKNCHVHHAPLEADCIKVSRARNISLIGCDLHDPGLRAAGNGPQETCDWIDVKNGLVRGNLFRWTTQPARQYFNAKAGSRDILIENNIFLNHNSPTADQAIQLGGYSSLEYIVAAGEEYEGINQIARNNIIIASTTSAIGIVNVNGAYIYNNLIYNCVTNDLISARTAYGSGSSGGNTNVYIFNNIFNNTNGDMPRVLSGTTAILSNVFHGNNLYYNAGVRILTGFYNPNTENGAIISDPQIAMLDSGDYNAIFNSLSISATSQAIDHGTIPDSVTPGVPFDMRGFSRPLGSAYDIGPLEFNPTKTEKNGLPEIKKEGILVHPNPFNPATTITLNTAAFNRQYTLEISDIYGRLIDKFKTNGAALNNGFIWHAQGRPSGIYIITVHGGAHVFSERLVLLK